MAKWPRRLLLLVLGFSAVALLVYLGIEHSCRSPNRQVFHRLRSDLLDVEVTPIETTESHQILQVKLEGEGDLRVVGHLERPTRATHPRPAFLLLGGVGTGRRILDYIPQFEEVVLLALDYPYEGKKSGLSVVEFATALPTMRRAVMRTIPAAMLAVDYLLTRPDVDPDRIVLVAGSLGALFAPAIGATDHRIAALVLLFGGGDIQSLLAHIAVDDLGWFTRPGAWLGKALTCPVEPLHHIGALSPRPILMINGTQDLGIPERNTRLLYEAANEPKTLHWIDAGHVLLQDPEFHHQVTTDMIDWLIDRGFVDPTTRPVADPQ